MKLELRSFPYQPFLIALFVGISIYVPNRVYFPVNVMILPMAMLFCLIGLILIIFYYMIHNLSKCKIFLSGTLLINFTYYSLHNALIMIHPFPSVTVVYLILFILLVFTVWKSTSSLADAISGFLDIIAIGLILISLANLSFSILSDAKEIDDDYDFEAQFQSYLNEDLASSLNSRDFYFIILDRYPGVDSLYAEFGFNNSDFIEKLRTMGFTVINGSRSNYGQTDYSIPSMLNMDYYDLVNRAGYDTENNRIWKFFKSQGFAFVYLPSNWYSTVRNDNADIILNPYFISLDTKFKHQIFQKIMFFERTFFGKIYYILMKNLYGQEMPSESINALQERIQFEYTENISEFQYTRLQVDPSNTREFILNTFKNLTQVHKIQGKKFIFAHINGWEYIPENISIDYPGYAQVIRINAANAVIESTIGKIINESDKKPVIVLLSDHGEKPVVDAIQKNKLIYRNYACYPDESLNQEFIQGSWYPVNNLEAFYLPDDGEVNLYSNITPVNAWRMILNHYFGTNFPRIDDRSYWHSKNGMCEVASS